MGRLSDKYVAGFFDADGSVSVVFHADCIAPQLRVAFSQKTEQDEVLHLIQKEYGGCLTYDVVNGVSYTKLSYSGNRQCEKLLRRIVPWSVIKRHYINVCLDVCQRKVNKSEHEAIRAYLKIQRKQRSLPLPKHPTRKWLAGYIDGDGCISATTVGRYATGKVVLHIAASDFDTEGIELIQKQFGGVIHDMCEGRVRQLVIPLSASKAKDIFADIARHMIVKRSQVEFILGCAEMGHYRDGKNIKAAMKHLKAHPHRLSEPKPNVAELLKSVRNLPPTPKGGAATKDWAKR